MSSSVFPLHKILQHHPLSYNLGSKVTMRLFLVHCPLAIRCIVCCKEWVQQIAQVLLVLKSTSLDPSTSLIPSTHPTPSCWDLLAISWPHTARSLPCLPCLLFLRPGIMPILRVWLGQFCATDTMNCVSPPQSTLISTILPACWHLSHTASTHYLALFIFPLCTPPLPLHRQQRLLETRILLLSPELWGWACKLF